MVNAVYKVQRLDFPAAKTFLWDKRHVSCRKANRSQQDDLEVGRGRRKGARLGKEVTRSKVSVTQAPELGVGKVSQACFSVDAPSGSG